VENRINPLWTILVFFLCIDNLFLSQDLQDPSRKMKMSEFYKEMRVRLIEINEN